MNCGTCTHWNLKDSPLRAHGFGLCKVQPDPALRAAKTTGAQNVCRLGRFAKADVKVIARREKESAVLP